MKTVLVNTHELLVGDQVLTHGATVEIVRIDTYPGNEQGGHVAACTSVLVGDDVGVIPPSWFSTPESLKASGCTWAAELPPGRYWNVQGNSLAKWHKVVKD